jgi:hypothetical protein
MTTLCGDKRNNFPQSAQFHTGSAYELLQLDVRKAGSPVIRAKAAAAAAPAQTSTRAGIHHSDDATALQLLELAVGMGVAAKVAAFMARLALYGVLLIISPGAKFTASLAAAAAAEAAGFLALVWSLAKIVLSGALITIILGCILMYGMLWDLDHRYRK